MGGICLVSCFTNLNNPEDIPFLSLLSSSYWLSGQSKLLDVILALPISSVSFLSFKFEFISIRSLIIFQWLNLKIGGQAGTKLKDLSSEMSSLEATIVLGNSNPTLQKFSCKSQIGTPSILGSMLSYWASLLSIFPSITCLLSGFDGL